MQAYFASRLRRAGTHKPADRKTIEREGWGPALVRAVRSISLAAFLVLYAMNKPCLQVLSLPLHDWLRSMGIVLGVLSLVLYAWSRTTLGKEWSSYLQMQKKQHLVTTGPYAWVRHPIYLSLMGFMTGLSLVGANWFLVAFLVVSYVDLILRIPKEEQMMVEEFGEEYEAYMRRTGKLLPK